MMNYMALTAASQWGKEVWGSNPAFSPERLALAGQVTLIGMLMVFAVLAILWGVLAIFKLIFAKSTKAEKAEKIAKPATSAPAKAPEAPLAPVAPTATDDAELVAILTAAVAAYISAEDPNAALGGFRVVSYRRTNGGRPWNSK